MLNSSIRVLLHYKKKKLRTEQSESNNSSEITKEFNKLELFSLAPDNTDILGWWKEYEKMFPILSHVAKIVLTIPCSSAKSERTFSCAGLFAKRNRLGVKKLEDLVILKENSETISSFKSDNPNLKTIADRNSFGKIRIEANGLQDIEDPDDYDLLHEKCDDDDDDNENDDMVVDDEIINIQ